MHQQPRTSSWAIFLVLSLAAACNPEDGGSTAAEQSTGTSVGATSSGDTGVVTTSGTGDGSGETTAATTGGTSGSGTESGTSSGESTTGGEPATSCTRLGGDAAVDALAQRLRDVVLADDRINAYFLNADIDDARLWSCIGEQVALMVACEGTEYTCADMATAHVGLGISAQDFADFAADFAQAFDADPGETTAEDRSALLAEIAAAGPGFIEDPTDDATIYQRIGRKPAIKAIVGAPGAPGSFLDRVALDPAINGFFAGADYPRLGTCLTRLLTSLDGPTRYGLEVDAPAEPGVGLLAPCRDMATAHAGLVDAAAEGISFADFGMILADLQQALAGAAVAETDRDVLLAAMGKLCVDVVAMPEKPECLGFYQTEVLAAQSLYTPIPDDAYDGTLGSMNCHAFEVADDGIDLVARVELSIGIAHPFIGDLVIKVQTPSLEVLTVLNRPGYSEVFDDGLGGPGDSSVLLGVQPIRFADDAPFWGDSMGSTLPAKQAVCVSDHQCDFRPSPGHGPGVNFTAFQGNSAPGTWKVCVGDANLGHVGTVNSIALTIDQQKYWQ